MATLTQYGLTASGHGGGNGKPKPYEPPQKLGKTSKQSKR